MEIAANLNWHPWVLTSLKSRLNYSHIFNLDILQLRIRKWFHKVIEKSGTHTKLIRAVLQNIHGLWPPSSPSQAAVDNNETKNIFTQLLIPQRFTPPWPKKLRQPPARPGALASALSSMHAPVLWHAWLVSIFGQGRVHCAICKLNTWSVHVPRGKQRHSTHCGDGFFWSPKSHRNLTDNFFHSSHYVRGVVDINSVHLWHGGNGEHNKHHVREEQNQLDEANRQYHRVKTQLSGQYKKKKLQRFVLINLMIALSAIVRWSPSPMVDALVTALFQTTQQLIRALHHYRFRQRVVYFGCSVGTLCCYWSTVRGQINDFSWRDPFSAWPTWHTHPWLSNKILKVRMLRRQGAVGGLSSEETLERTCSNTHSIDFDPKHASSKQPQTFTFWEAISDTSGSLFQRCSF